MATFTLTAIFSVVYIIAGMAAPACAGYTQFFIHRLLVTLVTAQFAMRTFQPEVGFIVVKVPSFPVAHVMAGVTCRTQAALVYILFLMARPAVRFHVLESRGGMAFFALNQEMFTQQREG